jgi:hypothetical protein
MTDTPSMPTSDPNTRETSMTERGQQLQTAAHEQITELIDIIPTLDEATLRLPCPGRDKLGDGTIAACTQHTADNYQRIATFVQTSDRMTTGHEPTQHTGHRIPRLLRALGHGSEDHADHTPGAVQHDVQYTADKMDLGAVTDQLSASCDTLAHIAELTDRQLDAIPPKDSFRFCDGQRTLAQVLTGLLKHQRHQVDAIKAATPSRPGAA